MSDQDKIMQHAPHPGPATHMPEDIPISEQRRQGAGGLMGGPYGHHLRQIRPLFLNRNTAFGVSTDVCDILRVEETDAPVQIDAINAWSTFPTGSTLGTIVLALMPINPPAPGFPNGGKIVLATAAVTTAGPQNGFQSNLLTWTVAGSGRWIMPGHKLVAYLTATNVYTGGPIIVQFTLAGVQGEALR